MHVHSDCKHIRFSVCRAQFQFTLPARESVIPSTALYAWLPVYLHSIGDWDRMAWFGSNSLCLVAFHGVCMCGDRFASIVDFNRRPINRTPPINSIFVLLLWWINSGQARVACFAIASGRGISLSLCISISFYVSRVENKTVDWDKSNEARTCIFHTTRLDHSIQWITGLFFSPV